MRLPLELGNFKTAAHAYDVYVNGRDNPHREDIVYVYANNRDQAARRAESAGYVVRSVNMVG